MDDQAPQADRSSSPPPSGRGFLFSWISLFCAFVFCLLFLNAGNYMGAAISFSAGLIWFNYFHSLKDAG